LEARRSAHELQQVDGTVVLLQGQGARDKRISFVGGAVAILGLQRYQSSERNAVEWHGLLENLHACVKVKGSVAPWTSEVGEMARRA
jgi:hypothetical protein